MEFDLLQDIVIIFGISVVVIFLFTKFKIPSIIGFLITGVLIGPYGFHLIENIHDVEILAEIGVVLLLFTIGIEFSMDNLFRIRKTILIGGPFQVLLTIGAIGLIAYYQGNPLNESVFIGFLIALSSTAIVLKLIQEKGEIYTPHGRTSLAILIFQDIIIVPMILLTPILAGNSSQGDSVWIILVKFISIIALVIIGSRWLVPKILYQVTLTKSRELFLLSIIVIAFAVAFLTYSSGLSLALGAFLAGLMISESKYSQHAMGNIIPFLDVFTSFFFVSIGMLMDISFFLANPIMILLFTILVLSVKTFLAGLTTFFLGYPLRTCLIVGFTLSQVGEFSFILSKIGISEGLLSNDNYQLFLAVSIMSMAATPLVINMASKMSVIALRLPLPSFVKNGITPKPISTIGKIKDHTIIIGYGLTGRNVAKASMYANIPHIIIEMNPDTYRKELNKGDIILFGDATQAEILHQANIDEALILVITIAISTDTKRIVATARKLNPHVHIIVRTRFTGDLKYLYELGADEVIPEDFETSVEIFSRVLIKYLVPHDEIEKLIDGLRSDNYEMFRSLSFATNGSSPLAIKAPGIEITTIHVCMDSIAVGEKIGSFDFYKKSDPKLIAISRSHEIIHNPGKEFTIEENDILFFLAESSRLIPYYDLFRARESGKKC